jgi:hypothetical protein
MELSKKCAVLYIQGQEVAGTPGTKVFLGIILLWL